MYTHWAVLALVILSSLVGVSDALELQQIPKCCLVQIFIPNEGYCYGLAWQGKESIVAASINKPLQNIKPSTSMYYTACTRLGNTGEPSTLDSPKWGHSMINLYTKGMT